MDQATPGGIDESGLRKGELRKLRALRKSLGTEIADRAFAEWLSLRSTGSDEEDTNAGTIVDVLWPLVQEGKLNIPRGGYLLRRGRGRIIVERHGPS